MEKDCGKCSTGCVFQKQDSLGYMEEFFFFLVVYPCSAVSLFRKSGACDLLVHCGITVFGKNTGSVHLIQ